MTFDVYSHASVGVCADVARGLDKKRPHHRGTKSGMRLPRMKQTSADRTAVLEKHVAALVGVVHDIVRNQVKAQQLEQRVIELVSKLVQKQTHAPCGGPRCSSSASRRLLVSSARRSKLNSPSSA